MPGQSTTKLWLPFYVADYLADTGRLTTEQHGAYFLLLLDYWRSGPLPDNDAILAQITRLSNSVWNKHAPLVRGFFTKGEDGLLHQKRADAELEIALENRETSRRRAQHAAEQRWLKDAQSNAQSNASGIPQSNARTMPEQCPSPSPSPTEETFNQRQVPSPNGELVLSSQSLKSSRMTSQKAEDTPSSQKASDPRFQEFVADLRDYWTESGADKSVGFNFDYKGADGGQLKILLKRSLTREQFRNCLRNRIASDRVTHCEPFFKWLGTATKYAASPLDEFQKPKGPSTNGNSRFAANVATSQEAFLILERERQQHNFEAPHHGRELETGSESRPRL